MLGDREPSRAAGRGETLPPSPAVPLTEVLSYEEAPTGVTVASPHSEPAPPADPSGVRIPGYEILGELGLSAAKIAALRAGEVI